MNGALAGKPTPGQIKGAENWIEHFSDKRRAAAKARKQQAAALRAKQANAPHSAVVSELAPRKLGLADLKAAAMARKAVA